MSPRNPRLFLEFWAACMKARKRRQVIIVTHNPNLVVNADADQCQRNTTLIHPEGGHADPLWADQASARASFPPFFSATRLRVARVR